MAQLTRIALIIAINALMCVLAKEELNSDQFENFDVLSILRNKTLLDEYYNCFMEIAPCKTLEQQRLTAAFGEAYRTKCRKCTKKQIEILNTITDWYNLHEPEKWRLVVEKTVNDLKKKYANDQ
ncbi:PREDICTED: ejaculatory bulb-specific protein 3-like [Wasmannia auropunctata]|uniref:ejaculatory bulb-specific protein 3-like n=1 Tax=Wasmannia auropunctata TaxID=64793 RepID=UPI0005EFF3A7|nr:PREDICTED: ejaculatory bulb-specific protein 3-like [Wasmannia auropunctata]